jgi:acyl-CoA thioesterase FadM
MGGLLHPLLIVIPPELPPQLPIAGQDESLGTSPAFRFVTAALHVDYLRPTPLGPPLQLRSRVTEIKERKVVIETDFMVDGTVTAKGKVVAVQIPESLIAE